MAIKNILKSTLLNKVVMAITGFFLILFVTGHMIGNLQVFAGREVFNTYAHFLQSLGELLWLIRISLFICLILHIITSIRLKALNLGAKPVGYKKKSYAKATFSARTMIWTGIMIFAFLVYHLMHFTIGVADPEIYGHPDYYDANASYFVDKSAEDIQGEVVEVEGEEMVKVTEEKVLFERHDAWYMVVAGFKKPLATIAYIVGMIILGFHIAHSLQSMFQTLAISGDKFTPWMMKFSNWFAVLLVLGYISIPITILLGLFGGGV